jgi:hypothetical protein
MAPPLPNSTADKYKWALIKGVVHCYPSDAAVQLIYDLWQVRELTPFHDAELAQATKAIKNILRKVQKNNKDPNRTLSFIIFGNRPLLVWAQYGAIGPDDNPKKIEKALRLKLR